MKQKFKYCMLLFAFLVFQGVMAQNKTVTGTVTDVSGSPLPGVNVVEKGTSNGTSTDFDGNYNISVAENATLVFSSLGYATTEMSVAGTTTANISLADDAESLDEVVVTALGIERDRRSLGYAVTQLGGESVA